MHLQFMLVFHLVDVVYLGALKSQEGLTQSKRLFLGMLMSTVNPGRL